MNKEIATRSGKPAIDMTISEEERIEKRRTMRLQYQMLKEHNAFFCGDCGRRFHSMHGYRCYYCGIVFCSACSRTHFAKGDDSPCNREEKQFDARLESVTDLVASLLDSLEKSDDERRELKVAAKKLKASINDAAPWEACGDRADGCYKDCFNTHCAPLLEALDGLG